MTLSNGRRQRVAYRVVLVGACCVFCAALYARMMWGAYQMTEQSRRLVRAGDKEGEIRFLRRAMAFYIPGNPWVLDAKATLALRAQEAEESGDQALALSVWRDLRGSILALRSTYQPFANDLASINARIAHLSARHPEASADLRTAAGEARLLRRLGTPSGPDPIFSAIGLFGFVCWVTSAIWMIWRGLSPALAPTRQIWVPALAALLSFLAFAGGMALA